MLSTMNSGMIGGPDTIQRSPGLLTPEVQSLMDTVIKSVLGWAAQQRNSNSLGVISQSRLGPCPIAEQLAFGDKDEAGPWGQDSRHQALKARLTQPRPDWRHSSVGSS
jgi:hypothetical protein